MCDGGLVKGPAVLAVLISGGHSAWLHMCVNQHACSVQTARVLFL